MAKKQSGKACLLSFFALVVLLCLTVSCNVLDNNMDGKMKGTPIRGTHDGLSETTEIQIINDCYEQHIKPYNDHPDITVDNLVIERYGGIYNGCVVAVIQYFNLDVVVGIHMVLLPYKVADTYFYNFWTVAPIVWKDGLFYSLQEAYDSGWLTEENLQSIADRINPEWMKDFDLSKFGGGEIWYD